MLVVIRVLLDRLGYDADIASNGAEAVQRIQESWRDNRAADIDSDNATVSAIAAAAVRRASRRTGSLYAGVLMDVHMPELDGLEATRRIRLMERERASGKDDFELPIIAITAGSSESDRAVCLAAGMNDFVAKPLDFDILKAKLTKWCGR